jgi:hypothetical protein
MSRTYRKRFSLEPGTRRLVLEQRDKDKGCRCATCRIPKWDKYHRRPHREQKDCSCLL